MKVEIIKLTTTAELPKYAQEGDAGMDIYADLPGAYIVIHPFQIAKVPTGIALAIPEGYEGQVRSRSGLASKHGICVVNSPGTIDSGYRGECGVALVNLGNDPYTINDGDRIAQLLVKKVDPIELVLVEKLSETTRGTSGFGSTGK